MKTYADLNLIKIRDDCGLDFARHTYSSGQCSCCYGPEDMGKKWWAKGKKPKQIVTKCDAARKTIGYSSNRKNNEFTFILFKNADNGSGHIKSLDEPIKNHTFVSYDCSQQQLEMVCRMLQEQLGAMYYVKMPKNKEYCINICYGTLYTIGEALEKVKLHDYLLRKGSWFYFDETKGRMDPVTFDASFHKEKYDHVIYFE